MTVVHWLYMIINVLAALIVLPSNVIPSFSQLSSLLLTCFYFCYKQIEVWIYVSTWECLHLYYNFPEALCHKNVIDLVVLKIISLLVIILEVVLARRSECGTGLPSEHFTLGRRIIPKAIKGKCVSISISFPYIHAVGQLGAYPPSMIVPPSNGQEGAFNSSRSSAFRESRRHSAEGEILLDHSLPSNSFPKCC